MSPKIYVAPRRYHHTPEQQGETSDPVFKFQTPADMALHGITLRFPGLDIDAHRRRFDFMRLEIRIRDRLLALPAIGLGGPDPIFKFVQPFDMLANEVAEVAVVGNPPGELLRCILWFSGKESS